MDNDPDRIYPMICNEFKKGSNKTEAFLHIWKRIEQLHGWQNWLQSDNYSLKREVYDCRQKLVCKITGQYLKLSNAICHHVDLELGTEVILNDRTLFVDVYYEDVLILIDTFTGKSKKLREGSQQQERLFIETAALIDSHRLLVGAYGSHGYHLYLLKLEFDTLTYSILDKFARDFSKIILDSKNNNKFALYGRGDNRNWIIYTGHLNGNKIHVEEQRIEVDAFLFHLKLTGDRLFAFRSGLYFCEYDLGANQAREVNGWINNCHTFSYNIPHSYSAYVWSGKRLYATCGISNEKPFSIVVFDAETHEWAETNFSGLGQIVQLRIEEDELLIASSTEWGLDEKRDKTVYRLPMKKPDKLQYIAWGTIRRGSLFAGSDLYQKFSDCLPLNSEFRPFADY